MTDYRKRRWWYDEMSLGEKRLRRAIDDEIVSEWRALGVHRNSHARHGLCPYCHEREAALRTLFRLRKVGLG
jgi:hypothetical protein